MKEIAFHVFTTHTAGFDDGSPMQLVSAERLQYLLALEAASLAFVAAAVAAAGGTEPAPAALDGA